MRVLLIGCVKSSELFLKKLIEIDADIVGVVTKKQSEFNSDYVDLGTICKKQKIDYIYVENANSNETKEYIKEKNVDLLLCLGWSQLLDKELLSLPKLGSVGFHPAELPQNRGRHPLIWALALGLKKTASTLFLLDSSADTGDIISQECVDIDYNDDAETLYNKVMEIAVKQLETILTEFETNTLNKVPQDITEGNLWRKRGKRDGEIDWRMSSFGIYNLVRALTKPYVGAHFVYRDKEYKVWKVKEVFQEGFDNIEPGKVVCVKSDTSFIVKVQDNLIEVLECDKIDIKEGEYL